LGIDALAIELRPSGVRKCSINASDMVVNQDSADYDFRVESNNNSHMLFVDAGNNSVGIGTSTSIPTNISNKFPLAVQANVDADAIAIKGRSSDDIGELSFYENDATSHLGNLQARVGSMRHRMLSNGGAMMFECNDSGGNLRTRQALYGSEAVFNDGSMNYDFRVETNNNTHGLFVNSAAAGSGDEAVCIGTSDVSVAGNTGSAKGINLNISSGYIEVAAYQQAVAYFNRLNNDGTIIILSQNGVTEGTISVSGSTVSYNGFAGRHESSGIATSTAKGTVVSTIDDLDVYPDFQNTPDGSTKPNPKAGQTRADHAKVKVSDSVGDARVYGVVDNFDENDKLFVISVGIASVKVTGSCSGGDLLESNGDGTAKVQSDDIVRSKTLGKVTIGNSDTGVKLVSCVMYCG